MVFLRRASSALVLALWAGSGATQANEAVTSAVNAEVPNPILRPGVGTSEAVSRPHARRSVTPETAAKLATVVPKYERLPAETVSNSQATPQAGEDSANGVVQLPKYIVIAPRERVGSGDAFLSPKARLELAYKQAPGLRVGSLPLLSNDGGALDMAAETDRGRRVREVRDLETIMPALDVENSREVRRALQEIKMRSTTWTDRGGSLLQAKR